MATNEFKQKKFSLNFAFNCLLVCKCNQRKSYECYTQWVLDDDDDEDQPYYMPEMIKIEFKFLSYSDIF